MRHTTTHTYVVLEISREAYDEIRGKLDAAGYQHAFHETDEGERIDMHGIALGAEEISNDEDATHVKTEGAEVALNATLTDASAPDLGSRAEEPGAPDADLPGSGAKSA